MNKKQRTIERSTVVFLHDRSIQLYHCFILTDACFGTFCCLLELNDDDKGKGKGSV